MSNQQKVLDKLTWAAEQSSENMNKVSDFIKQAEKILQDRDIGFDYQTNCLDREVNGILRWDSEKQRIMYVVGETQVPLIETRFTVRKAVVDTTFTQFLNDIADQIIKMGTIL